MKQFLKKLVYRALRPAMRDVSAQLAGVEGECRELVEASRRQAGVLEALSAENSALRAQRAGQAHSLAQMQSRLDAVQGRLTTGAVWKGGLKGQAFDLCGSPVPAMTAKYFSELAFWEAVVKRESVTTWGRPFEEIYGSWQRIRMTELSEFLGLVDGSEDPIQRLAVWAMERVAVEIGSGPFPAISLVGWKQASAVDPLAEGYIAEDLLPRSVQADRVTFLAATGESIPLAAGTTDLVVLENCLDHVEDPALVMRECRRLLRGPGLAWILVDLMDYKDHMHPNPFSEESIRRLLKNEGFETVRERVNDHKSHPQAYGEYRALVRKCEAPAGAEQSVVVVPSAAMVQRHG